MIGMTNNSKRLVRERRTIRKMVEMYCRDQHKQDSICGECKILLDYSLSRIDHCRFGADKPVCAKCTSHCYKKDMREAVRKIMRHSGPKMLFRHPYLAIMHLIDAMK